MCDMCDTVVFVLYITFFSHFPLVSIGSILCKCDSMFCFVFISTGCSIPASRNIPNCLCIILYIFLQTSAYNRCGMYPKTLQSALEFIIKFCGFEQSLDDSEAAMLVGHTCSGTEQ